MFKLVLVNLFRNRLRTFLTLAKIGRASCRERV